MNPKLLASRALLVIVSVAAALKFADYVIGRVDPAGISHFANHNAFTSRCVERKRIGAGAFEMDFAIPNTRADANVVYAINSLGFRGRDYQATKPEGTYRIVVLGDSVTFGWGVSLEDRYTDFVEHKLATENAGGKTVEILNLALPGYETMHHFYVFKNAALKLQPDAVVVAFNRNDVQNDTSESINLQFLSRQRIEEMGWWAKLFVDDPTRTMLEKTLPNLRLLGVHRYLYSLRENDGAYLTELYGQMKNGIDISLKLLAEMNTTCSGQGMRFGVVDLHDVQAIAEACRQRGIPYQSISYPNDITDMSLRNSAVDPHPNAKGHALHAARFEAALREFGMVPGVGN